VTLAYVAPFDHYWHSLEKFMTLSQPLLNSTCLHVALELTCLTSAASGILANQDVQHVFNVS
jgi:hypothetical protein